jgi:enamine deaminase RidA (YjgF/YER057c/UK114 family)
MTDSSTSSDRPTGTSAETSARTTVSSGTPWEAVVGYSRAVRVGDWISVAGTTAPGATAADQTRAAISRIESALGQLGASLGDVVRTRIFLTDISQWKAVGRVHGEFFGEIRPASSMVEVSALIDTTLLVEVEADAVVRHPSPGLADAQADALA